jgi:hypothetical protein
MNINTHSPITAHNAGWLPQFRFRGSRHQPGVCEFWRYGGEMRVMNTERSCQMPI